MQAVSQNLAAWFYRIYAIKSKEQEFQQLFIHMHVRAKCLKISL